MLQRVLLTIILLNVYITAQTGSFINGADVSFIPQLEDNEAAWYNDGTIADPLDIFQQNNINYIRLRLWHSPAEGYNNLEKTLMMAARIKAMGFKFLLNFHYSDTWADNGWQQKPAAWDSLSFQELNDSLYAYTFNVIHTFDSLDLLPDMVQIGNEITNGFLQPDGLIDGQYPGGPYNTPAQWEKFTTLLTTASNAVNDAVQNTTIPVMIHIDNGIGNIAARRFLDSLQVNNVQYDIIGLSFYPWWHGTLTSLTQNVNDLAVRYDKDIIVVETAYPWTLDSVDDTLNFVTNSGQLHTGYPASLSGQYSFLYDLIQVIKNIPNGKGKGLFYWEPEWISTPTFSSVYENLTFFDFQGDVLGSVGVFREPGIPLIDTLYVNFLPSTPVLLNVKVNTGNQSTTVRFQWDTDNNGVWLNDQTSDISPIIMDGISNLNITGLTPNTLYYYRAYVSNAGGTDTSVIKSFITKPTLIDTFYMTNSIDDIMYESGAANSSVSRFGESSDLYRGLEQIYKAVTIPKGATVLSAELEVRAFVSSSTGTAVTDVYSDLRNNPVSPLTWAQFNTSSFFSTIQYRYSAPAYVLNQFYRIDITNVIKDRINKPDWVEGNNLGVLIKGNTTLSTVYREIFRAETSLQNNKLIIAYELPVIAKVKIFLEGPYNTSTNLMSTSLNSPNNHIPLTSPYSASERTAANIPAGVVDWVEVELRESDGLTKVTSKSVFLRNDGMIVGDNGTEEYITFNTSPGDYYIVVRHRNHLAVMSTNTITLNQNEPVSAYDFTSSPSQFYGTGGAKELETNIWGMISGDGTSNGSITAADNNSVWLVQFLAGEDGYKSGDYNLSGSITASDNNLHWLVNNGKDSQVPQ